MRMYIVRGLCEFKHCTVSQAQSHRRGNQNPTNFVGLSMAPKGVGAAVSKDFSHQDIEMEMDPLLKK